MTTAKRPSQVALDLEVKIPPLIAQGFRIAALGADNAALLVNPNPTPGTILAATTALETANTAAGAGGKGLVAARGLKEKALRTNLNSWGSYLETLAAANPGQEKMILEAGGARERATGRYVKPPLRLTQPGGPGTARAACRAAPKGKKAFYGWRLSLDGGKTFILSQTNDSYTNFANIPSGTEIQVEFNVTMKNVTSAWSAPATLLVN